jgi:hypothetical protein
VTDRAELHPDGSPFVHLSTGDEQSRCRPQCGFRAVRVKQWTTTQPRDLPMAGHTGITNAGSEGTNRVIKTVARDAYGFRNPASQRLRTRTATTRRHRRHLNPA